MDTRQAAIWLGFTVGAVSILLGFLMLSPWLSRRRRQDASTPLALRMTPGAMLSLGCMDLLMAAMLTWPSIGILPLAVMAAGVIVVVLAFVALSPLIKQMLGRIDELS